jgi:hypothetical protein
MTETKLEIKLDFMDPRSVSQTTLDRVQIEILDYNYLVTSKGRKVKKDSVLSGPIPKQFKSTSDM